MAAYSFGVAADLALSAIIPLVTAKMSTNKWAVSRSLYFVGPALAGFAPHLRGQEADQDNRYNALPAKGATNAITMTAVQVTILDVFPFLAWIESAISPIQRLIVVASIRDLKGYPGKRFDPGHASSILVSSN